MNLSTSAGRVASVLGPVAFACALLFALFLAVGVDPRAASYAFLHSNFGSLRTFGEGLVRATPLLIISLTLLPSLQAGLFNVGAPGQVGAGALAATVVALRLPGWPAWLVVVALRRVGVRQRRLCRPVRGISEGQISSQ